VRVVIISYNDNYDLKQILSMVHESPQTASFFLIPVPLNIIVPN